MIFWYLALFYFSNPSFATEAPCDLFSTSGSLQEISGILSKSSIPNCIELTKVKKASRGSTDEICSCKNEYQANYGQALVLNAPSLEEQKKIMVDALIEEHVKNRLKQNKQLLNAWVLPDMPGGAPLSQKACKQKSIEDFTRDCKSKSAIKYFNESELLKSLPIRILNETALSVDKGNLHESTKGLLRRDGKKSCGISEADATLALNLTLEDTFFETMVSNFDAFKAAIEDTDSIYEAYDEVNQSKNQDGLVSGDSFLSMLKHHPYIGPHTKNPKDLIAFISKFKGVKDPKEFKTALYQSKDIAQDFDKNFAESCEKSFNELKTAICSEDFEKGNLDLGIFKDIPKFLGVKKLSSDELASSALLRQQNEKVLAYCAINPTKNGISLQETSRKVSSSLEPEEQDMPIKTFLEQQSSDPKVYNKELCEIKDTGCKAGKEDSLLCNILTHYNNSKVVNSFENMLSSQKNASIGKVFAASLSSTDKPSAEVKKVLVDNQLFETENVDTIAAKPVMGRTPGEFYNNVAPKTSSNSTASSAIKNNSNRKTIQDNNLSQSENSAKSSYQPSSSSSSSPSQVSASANEEPNPDTEERSAQYRNGLMDRANEFMNKGRENSSETSFKSKNLPGESRSRSALPSMRPSVNNIASGLPNTAFYQNGDGPSAQQQNDKTKLSDIPSAAEEAKKDAAFFSKTGRTREQDAKGSAVSGTEVDKAKANSSKNSNLDQITLNLDESNFDQLIQKLKSGKDNKNLSPEEEKLLSYMTEKKNFSIKIRGQLCEVIFDQTLGKYKIEGTTGLKEADLLIFKKFEDEINNQRKFRVLDLKEISQKK